MSAPTIVAIEGGVCAGKTTLVARLARDSRIATFPEYVEWIRATGRPLPTGTPAERLTAFLAVEEERAAIVAASASPVVLDRSALTLIGFEFAMAQLYLDTAWFDLKRILSKYRISCPAGVILLDVDDEIRINMWGERGLGPDSIFVNQVFNRNLRSFYDNLAEHTHSIRLRPFETSEKELLTASRKFIEGCEQRTPLDIMGLIDALKLD